MAIVAAGIITALIITILSITLPAMMGQLLGHLLYNIGKLILDLADFMQMIFRRLAGLDVYWFKDGKSYYHNLGDSWFGGYDTTGSDFSAIEHDVINNSQQEGDILLKLFSSNAVVEALIAMTLFAVALLLIVTIIQIIRVEYTTEGSKNSKGTIIGKALKSLAMFILVPVVCFLGVFVSNKLLAAVDSATAQSGANTLSGYIFLAASADANVIRCGEADHMPDAVVLKKNDAQFKANLNSSGNGLEGWKTTYFSSNKASAEARRADIANDIDQLFVGKYNKHDEANNTVVTISEAKDGTVSFKNINKDKDTFVLHYSFVRGVEYFYNLLDINYLILYFGGFMTLMSLFRASFGLVLRLYKATALFIISPGVTALTPIDDGNAYKQWRKSFVANVLGAYGFVIAMNLLFLLLGIIDNIHLFDPNNFFSAAPNALVRAVMVIVGVNMLEDLAKQISGFIGGADILSEGKAASEKAGKTIGKIGSVVGGGIMMASGAVGGIAAKIYSARANNATASKKYNKHSDELKKLKETDTTGWEEDKKRQHEAAIQKHEKWLDDHKDESAESRAESFRNRAATGARAQIRGRETLKNMWEGSAVGSFLNTATGGYVPLFGGKTVENIDKKLEDKHSGIYSLADKDDGKGLTGFFGFTELLKKMGGALPNMLESTKNVYNSQQLFEQRKVASDALEQSVKSGRYDGIATDQQVKTYERNEEKHQRDEKNTSSFKNQLISMISEAGGYNKDTAPEFIDDLNRRFQELLSVGKSTGSVWGLEHLEGIDPTNIVEKLSGFNVDKLQANQMVTDSTGKPIAYSDYKNSEEGVKGAAAEALKTHEERVRRNGLGEIDNTVQALSAYDEWLKKHPEKDPNYKPPTGGKDGDGKDGGDGSKDIKIDNANVKMDNSKVDMQSTDTKINDNNQIANKVAKSVGDAMKEIKEKKDKDVKENRTYEMLEKIQKILKNVEKNTKKK